MQKRCLKDIKVYFASRVLVTKVSKERTGYVCGKVNFRDLIVWQQEWNKEIVDYPIRTNMLGWGSCCKSSRVNVLEGKGVEWMKNQETDVTLQQRRLAGW